MRTKKRNSGKTRTLGSISPFRVTSYLDERTTIRMCTLHNRTALKIRKRPGVVRGSFGGRSKIVPGSFGIVRGSFGNPLEVVRRSFRIHSKIFQKFFSEIFGKIFEKYFNLLFSESLGRFHSNFNSCCFSSQEKKLSLGAFSVFVFFSALRFFAKHIL